MAYLFVHVDFSSCAREETVPLKHLLRSCGGGIPGLGSSEDFNIRVAVVVEFTCTGNESASYLLSTKHRSPHGWEKSRAFKVGEIEIGNSYELLDEFCLENSQEVGILQHSRVGATFSGRSESMTWYTHSYAR